MLYRSRIVRYPSDLLCRFAQSMICAWRAQDQDWQGAGNVAASNYGARQVGGNPALMRNSLDYTAIPLASFTAMIA